MKNKKDKLTEEINDIIEYFELDADYSKSDGLVFREHKVKELFKIGDYVVGNIHIAKDLAGENLKEALFINSHVGEIIELRGKPVNSYRVEFLEQIPPDDFYSVFGRGNNTGITILGDKTSNKCVLNNREVRKPTEEELEDYLIKKDSQKYNV